MVLAAGASSRLGRNKLLVELAGESLVRRAVRRAAAAGLDPVLAVVGHEADRVEAALAGLPVRTVFNPEHESGQPSSLKAGIAAVPDGAGAAVVALADMPLVTAGRIAALVERYRETGALAVASDYGGVLAPPILYDRALFPELLAMEGPGFAREILARHRGETLALSRPAEDLVDLDDEADLRRLEARLEAGAEAPGDEAPPGGARSRAGMPSRRETDGVRT